MKAMTRSKRAGFSLTEVVLALGVIAIAIVAILGIVPLGLSTGRGAQDETRAAQIAQAIISSVASQTQTQFGNIQIPLDDGSATPLDLRTSSTTTIYAGNDGKLSETATGAVYAITITTDAAPVGFDSGYANQVTVSVAWPASALANQTKRNFVRIASKY